MGPVLFHCSPEFFLETHDDWTSREEENRPWIWRDGAIQLSRLPLAVLRRLPSTSLMVAIRQGQGLGDYSATGKVGKERGTVGHVGFLTLVHS